MADPHACHIMPFSFNSNLQNRRRLGTLIDATQLFGDRPWPELLTQKVRSSDFAWNMLAVSPQLHVWWAQGRWAVKCLGITPVNNQHILTLEFHWMPQRSQLPQGREIDLDKDEGEQMLKELTTWNGDTNVTTSEDHGVIAISDARSHQPLRSGQIFEVRHSTNDDAEKMKDMVDLQWYLILACSLAGAADPPELEDDESDDDFDPNTLKIEPEHDTGIDTGIQKWLKGIEAAPPQSAQPVLTSLSKPGAVQELPSSSTGPGVLGSITNLAHRRSS